MKKAISLFTAALLMLLCLAGCGQREPDAIIEDIVTCYGCYGQEADAKVEELLAELDRRDSRQGKLWADIMDYWKYANTELKVNPEEPPRGLPEDDSLCITVLGFELNDDGTMKDELLGRLNVALSCAERYPKAYVLCTGGGTARNNPDATEAGLMGRWLLENGLAEERLILEDRSRTTAENASFSYEILRAGYPQINSILLVSSSYHIPWGSLLLEAAFMKAASEKQAPEIHIISNCAYPIVNERYKESEILRWELGGMLQLIGNRELAMQVYRDYDRFPRPEL